MNARTHFFTKIYLSHFILERVDVSYVWEVRRRQTATYWPKVLLATIAALLPQLGWTVQPWITEGPSPLSAAGSQFGILSQLTPTGTELELTSVAPDYIIIWRPPAFCGRTHLHRIQPRPQVKVIFRYLRPDAPVSLLHRCISWLTPRSRVNMLQFADLAIQIYLTFEIKITTNIFRYQIS